MLDETRDHGSAAERAEAAAAGAEKQSYLLFTGPDDAHMAMPLDTLARLEEFPASQVEKSGTRWVAQYRGQILAAGEIGLRTARKAAAQAAFRIHAGWIK